MKFNREKFKYYFAVGAVIVIGSGTVGAGIFSGVNTAPSNQPKGPQDQKPSLLVNVPCLALDAQTPDEHKIAVHLTVLVNDEEQDVPAGLGTVKEQNCRYVIFTTDESGTIHIEPATPQTFTLGDFFGEVGVPFDSTRIFNLMADATNTLTMTVNGKKNAEFDKLVFQDKQEIVIAYGEGEAKVVPTVAPAKTSPEIVPYNGPLVLPEGGGNVK